MPALSITAAAAIRSAFGSFSGGADGTAVAGADDGGTAAFEAEFEVAQPARAVVRSAAARARARSLDGYTR
ncbi:hypothetical protein GCM10010440_73500 [Kitasatospora cinereorecta]